MNATKQKFALELTPEELYVVKRALSEASFRFWDAAQEARSEMRKARLEILEKMCDDLFDRIPLEQVRKPKVLNH